MRSLPTSALLFVLFTTAAAVTAGPALAQTTAAEDEASTAWVTELKVKAALLDKIGPDALGVRVTVDRSQAILTGTVEKRSTQELAEEVAKSVEGVGSVDNKLRVTGSEAPHGTEVQRAEKQVTEELDDARLESRVKLRLFGELGRRARPIEVEASDGVVSLRGTVPDNYRRKLALETARGVSGVKKVVDLLKVGR
jgi:osmotically-inducible protein OsmY